MGILRGAARNLSSVVCFFFTAAAARGKRGEVIIAGPAPANVAKHFRPLTFLLVLPVVPPVGHSGRRVAIAGTAGRHLVARVPSGPKMPKAPK